jgi:hypothetical protein
VTYHLEISSGSHKLNVSFTKVAYDWELDVFASFFNLLYSLNRVGEMKTSFVRPPPREACSTLDHSAMSLSLIMFLISLESVFGGVRFP